MKQFEVYVNFDGTIIVSADSPEEACYTVREMSNEEIIEQANGCFDIDYAEPINEEE